MKVLYWERNGFVLWPKRLERDRVHWPRGDSLTVDPERPGIELAARWLRPATVASACTFEVQLCRLMTVFRVICSVEQKVLDKRGLDDQINRHGDAGN